MMWKMSNKKRKMAFLTALIGSLMAGSSVGAANLMATIPSDYHNSQMGGVTGSRVTTKVDAAPVAGAVKDLNGDPATFSVMLNGESKIFLRQYVSGNTDLKGSILMDADGDWASGANPTGVIKAVSNAHAVTGFGNTIYTAGYDQGQVGIAHVVGDQMAEDTTKTVDLKKDIKEKTGDVDAKKYDTYTDTNGSIQTTRVHGEGLLVKDGYLYVAASVNLKDGYDNYDNGYLMQYKINSDGGLSYNGYARIGKNTDQVKLNNYNHLILNTSIGGYQNYGSVNEETSLDYVNITGNNIGNLHDKKSIILPEQVKNDGYDFRDMKVLPDGTVYVMKYTLTGSGGGFTGRVYQTTMANLMSKNPDDWNIVLAGTVGKDKGWFGKLNAEYYTKRLWVEWGNNLYVYEDGDTKPTHQWETKDFSTDKQFYNFNSVTMLPTDQVWGSLAKLTTYRPEGFTASSETKITLENADAKIGTVTREAGITGTSADQTAFSDVTSDDGTYSFTKDEVLSINLGKEGDHATNAAAVIQAKDGKDITIDASGHTLQLASKNYIASPVGIYAGNGKNVTITADKVDVVTSGYSSGNSLTNAIWNDGGKNTASQITVNGDVNISMSGGYGGNGVAIQKSFRWGENSQESTVSSAITIHGNLKIAGEDSATWGIPVNQENVLSRFNNAGILTNIEKSKVTVTGDVDMAVYGNGITTNAVGSEVSIGGGHITVPQGTKYGYYTLGAYAGTINVNMNEAGSAAGTHDVQLDGDVFALKSTGTINLGLATKNSYLNGIIDNGGKVNMWLQNGSVWTNEAKNTRYKQDDEDVGNNEVSRVTFLHGGTKSGTSDTAGVIIQTENSKSLTIDNFFGAAKVLYSHDSNTPTKILGGDVNIGTASSGSEIVLRTDYDDNMQSDAVKNQVLNALAEKLYYKNAVNGEKFLSGKVEIAEGLTASSVAKYTGNIAFNQKNGQGFHDYTPATDDNEQSVTEFTQGIFGKESHDTQYVKGNVLQNDGTYRFTKDSNITIDEEGTYETIDGSDNAYDADVAGRPIRARSVIAAIADVVGDNIVIDAANKDLSLGITARQDDIDDDNAAVSLITASGTKDKNANVAVTAKNLNLSMSGDVLSETGAAYMGFAVYADNNSNVTLNSNVNIQGIDGVGIALGAVGGGNGDGFSQNNVTVKGDLAITDSGAGIYIGGGESKVVVKGKTNIDNVRQTYGGIKDDPFGVGIYNDSELSDDAAISLGASNIQLGEGLSAVYTQNGTININNGADGTKTGTTNITGNLAAEGGIINLTLADKDSSLHGLVQTNGGKVNLDISNGAVWDNKGTNKAKGMQTKVNYLSGNNGYIYQNNAEAINVANYSGVHTVVYEHDEKNPTSIIGGNFNIAAADANSVINLVTDNKGIASGYKDTDAVKDRNTVSEVLNKLAQKLFYTSTDGKLTGSVKIADGLTASSATLKSGDISFSTATTGTNVAGQGFYDYTPATEKVYNTGAITKSEDISLSRELDESGVAHVSVTESNAGNNKFASAIYAGESTSPSSPMTVKMSGKGLALNAAQSSGQAAAIYAGANTYIKVMNPSADQKLTITANNTDTRGAHGIYADAYAHLNISGPVEITDVITQGDAATGINIQGKQSEITIDGPLTIRNVKGLREKGAGVNASGIQVTGESSTVTVSGPVDISGVRGSGIKLTGADTKVSVGGGTITAAEDSDHSHNFYAVRVDKGTLDINMKDGAAGDTTTKITGDMYATGQYGKKVVEYTGGELIDWKDAGILNVALTDKDSFWKGVAAYDMYNDNYGTGGNTAHDIGQFNLYLQNGATWTNEQQSHVTTTTIASKNPVWAGSTLATLHGGKDADNAGLIYQKDNNPISVVNYSGHTTVFYEHDANDPTKMIGGSFHITNAAEGSAITFITDNKGITSGFADGDSADAKDKVANVLNNLAGKLFYKNYTDGHLSGVVKIAEGLTASSAALKTGDISFSTEDTGTFTPGQGYYDYKTSKPGSQITKEFTTAITGDAAADTVYIEKGVLKDDDTYVFTADSTTITPEKHLIAGGAWLPQISAAISGSDENHNVTIDMNGNKLTVDTTTDTHTTSIAAIGKGVVNINNAGAMSVTATSTKGGQTGALFVNAGGTIQIHNAGADNVLTLRAKSTAPANAAVIKSMNGVSGVMSSITVDGLVDILAEKSNASGANEAISAVASKVEIGGGVIKAINGAEYAIRAYGEFASKNRGQVNVNVKKDAKGAIIGAGSNTVQLEGNVYLGGGMDNAGANADVSLGLNTKDSFWKGDVSNANGSSAGIVNLYMGSGASWTGNNLSGNTVNANLDHATWTGSSSGNAMHLTLDNSIWNVNGASKIASFSGNKGSIFVASDAGDISVADYSGNVTVIYNHDANHPTNILGGSFTIGQSKNGSAITLITDNQGITKGFTAQDKAEDQNMVNEVLNKLAQKLFYTANDSKLAGTVKIAEGLTASSKALKTGNISFSTDATGTKTPGQGFYEYTVKDDSVITDPITGNLDKKYENLGIETEKGIYNFTQDTVIDVTKGDYSSNLSAIESSGGPITINADGKNLDVSYHVLKGSNVARAVATGLSYGKSKDVTITAKSLKLSTDTTGFYAQGVYATGGKISIDADTTISTAAQTESNGIYSGNGGTVTMNGNLTIQKDSKAANYIALKSDDNGVINVNMKDGKAGTGVVKIDGDVFTKSAESYDYWEDETTSTTSTVNLALQGKDSRWNGRSLYGVTSGDDSTDYGIFNLWLADGASWTNEKNGKVVPSGFTGSRVTKLTGGSDAAHAGNIFQKDSKALTIDNYSGYTNIYYAHEGNGEAAENYKAGDTIIKKAAEGSVVSLITDNTGIVMDNEYSVANVLNALAGKLTYSNFTKGEKNLTGYVKIAGGLTASSQTLQTGSIAFSKKDGKGSYKDGTMTPGITYPEEQVKNSYTQAITGNTKEDYLYKQNGVLKDDGTYVFTADSTTITPEKHLIAGGAWLPQISAGISGSDENHNVTMNMNGNKLTVDTTTDTHTTGIAAIGKGVVNINHAGAISISAESTKGGQTGALFVNAGGTIHIHNAGTDNVLTLRAKSTQPGNAAVIKSMNGVNGVMSTITVDGLVDIVADKSDASGTNEGISAVASRVEVGGGVIKAINGAAYAIRAYGEYVSKNRGQVNVNVKKDAEGAIIGAGNNHVQMEGNVYLGGGMDNGGASADVSIGLNTKDSFWKGDVSNTSGSSAGIVNLYMGNGASWTGNNLSGNTVNANLDQATWTGHSNGNAMNLTLDHSIWNVNGASKLASFSGDQGSIFVASDAGDISVGNYSGNTNIYYAHEGNGEAAENYKAGDTIIQKAAEGSVVSLITDNSGVSMDNEYSVANVLNALAGKLTYRAYVNGEKNLTGYVKIADGLTASSQTQQTGNIAFSEKDGKGSYKDGTMTPGITYPDEQQADTYTQAITGNTKEDYLYKQNGVLKEEGKYTFTKDPTKIAVAEGAAVNAKADITIDTTKAKLELKGADAGINAEGASVTVNGNTSISGATGINAANGNVTLTGSTVINGTDAAINAGADANVVVNGNNSALTINGGIHADGGSITVDSGKATGIINGDVSASNGGSVEISLNDAQSKLTGSYKVDANSGIVMNIKNGATWVLTDDRDETAGMSLLRMAKAPAAASAAGLNVNGGATKADTGYIDMTKRTQELNISNYSGYETFILAHKDDGTFTSGDVKITKAKAGSGMTLFTANNGINMADKDAVTGMLKALAKKAFYAEGNDAGNGKNLTGEVKIGEGLTSSSAKTGLINFAEKQGQLVDGSIQWEPTIEEGDYETFVMKGARSAVTTSFHSWRDNMQDTYTGADLADEDGIFAKALGGKTSSDVSGLKDSNSYWGAQVGYDKALANGWHTGVAFDYRDGDSDYLLGGKGDNKLYSFGVYGVKKMEDGSYFRVAAKAGRVENEYDVYTELRNKLHADYKANAYGLTAEYGKTFGSEMSYITPKVQLTWSRVGSKDYTGSANNGAIMNIYQDSYDSLVGRLGFEAGMKKAHGSLHAGLYLAHEFNGDIDTRYFAKDGGWKSTSFDGDDTWAELVLGGEYRVGRNSQLYADFARDLGGDFQRKWKLNAGIRLRF